MADNFHPFAEDEEAIRRRQNPLPWKELKYKVPPIWSYVDDHFVKKFPSPDLFQNSRKVAKEKEVPEGQAQNICACLAMLWYCLRIFKAN